MLYQVDHNMLNNELECSCKLFVRLGILCRHAFFLLNHGDVLKIPRQYVVQRWMKNAEELSSTANNILVSKYINAMETTTIKVNDIWFDFQSCVSLAGCDPEKLNFLHKELRSINSILRGKMEEPSSSKKKEFLGSLVGNNDTDCITIHVPHEIRNKGCGKRILSGSEISMKEQKKNMRKCKTCQKFCTHDSRNCPSKKN